MDKHYMTRCYDIDGEIYVEDVECEFEVEIEDCPLEPYSWGQSRGSETEVNAVATSIKLGGLRLDRNKADLVFGKAAMERIDEAATTYVEENLADFYDEAA